jgi:heme/copper-type cytochrome/quinol oxidase subunit 1
VYFWFPKMTGRLLDDRLGKQDFWLTLIGFHTTFFGAALAAQQAMPRRYADHLPTDGFTTLNVNFRRIVRTVNARATDGKIVIAASCSRFVPCLPCAT